MLLGVLPLRPLAIYKAPGGPGGMKSVRMHVKHETRHGGNLRKYPTAQNLIAFKQAKAVGKRIH